MKTSSDKIFVLCGFSASGKDSLLNMASYRLSIPFAVSHTSRPQRDKEVSGKDYHFVSRHEFQSLIANKEMIEYRTYNTLVDNIPDVWYYGLSKSSIGKSECICVLDTIGVNELKRIYGDRVVSIFIDCSEPTRRTRAIARGNFSIVEWERRLKDDKKIFSQLDFEEFDLIIDNSKKPEIAFDELSEFIKRIRR
jgi:guanylate kinase